MNIWKFFQRYANKNSDESKVKNLLSCESSADQFDIFDKISTLYPAKIFNTGELLLEKEETIDGIYLLIQGCLALEIHNPYNHYTILFNSKEIFELCDKRIIGTSFSIMSTCKSIVVEINQKSLENLEYIYKLSIYEKIKKSFYDILECTMKEISNLDINNNLMMSRLRNID
jgi:uncharacterized protein (DUF1919 family)